MRLRILVMMLCLLSYAVFSDSGSGNDLIDDIDDMLHEVGGEPFGEDAPVNSDIWDDIEPECDEVIEITDDFEMNESTEDICFVINDDNVEFDCDGYTISGSGPNDGRVGIFVDGVDDITITNCDIESIQYGIILLDSKDSTIISNNILDTSFSVYLGQDCEDGMVKNNEINEFISSGVWLHDDHGSEIEDNEFNSGDEYGLVPIYVSQSIDSNVEGNIIHTSEVTAIAVYESETIKIDNNKVNEAGTDGYGDGIGILNSEECMVKDNEIENAATAGINIIAEDNSKGCIVKGNEIIDSSYGIIFGMDNIIASSNDIENTGYGVGFLDYKGDDLEGCVFANSSIDDSDDEDVYVVTDDIIDAVLANINFNDNSVFFEDGCDDSTLLLKEYIIIKIIDNNEDPIEDAEVTFENGKGDEVYDEVMTDSSGETDQTSTLIGEYSYDSGDDHDYDDYSDHEVHVEYSGSVFEGDLEIDDTDTYIIELEDVELDAEEDKLSVGDLCDEHTDCQSGVCCESGLYEGVCKAYQDDCIETIGECMANNACEDNEICLDNECVEVECDCGIIEDHACVEYQCCVDTDCGDSAICVDNLCSVIDCDCGEVVNHSCVDYECCDNDDCLYTELCEQNSCKPVVQDTCGEISNHEWIDYECCNDTICGFGMGCQNNVCVDVEEEKKPGICPLFLIFGFISVGFIVTYKDRD